MWSLIHLAPSRTVFDISCLQHGNLTCRPVGDRISDCRGGGAGEWGGGKRGGGGSFILSLSSVGHGLYCGTSSSSLCCL